MSATKHTCAARVWRGYHSYTCGKAAKAERDGKWYCGTHDPERLRAKDEAREAKWAHERAIRDAEDAINSALDAAARLVESGAWREADLIAARSKIIDARADLANLEAKP